MFDNSLLCGSLVVLLGLTGCPGDGKKKMEERQKQLDEKKEAQAKAEAKTTAAPAKEVVQLDKPWEDSSYVMLRADAACPDNFWALFPGDPPGANKDEKKANGARRADLAKALREQTYLVKLRGPDDVKLLPFDATKNEFPVEVLGTIDCSDSIARVAIAWSAIKAGDPGASAAKEGADVTQNVWMGTKLRFALPMKGMADAKEFEQKNKLGLSARLFFKLGKVEVDKKLKKMPKVKGEGLDFGGGVEDWGAGRMVRAEAVGTRLAIDKEKTTLIEKKP